MEQISTIERLKSKLRYVLKDIDQLCNLPNLKFTYFISLNISLSTLTNILA